MSYDLYLKPRAASLDPEAVLAYFRGRPKYTVEGQLATYENEDTDVQFEFEIDEPEADPLETDYPVLFHLAYVRPSFFVLEAEPEVTAFVRAFDCVVRDLQTDGMGEGEYRADRLASGWNAGNEFACNAMLQFEEVRKDVVTLPRDKLHEIWRWNYERAALQERVGAGKFVPRIFAMLLDGTLSTVILWGDGVPMVFPAVDYVIARASEQQPQDHYSLLSWREAVAILEPYMRAHGTGAFVLDYNSPPNSLIDAIGDPGPLPQSLKMFHMDAVLDTEIVARILQQR